MNDSQSLQWKRKSAAYSGGGLEHREPSFSFPEYSEFEGLNMICLPSLNDFPVLKKHYSLFDS